MIGLFAALLGINRVLTYLVFDSESRCPETSVSNYWVWDWTVHIAHGTANVLGPIYWHAVRQLPGAYYRRFFLPWQASYGAWMTCVAVWGFVLRVVAAASADSLES